ncbi:glutathione S-transferase family protein [Marimonas sp. MJW-29]|uniref:glutathione transferase n=1 Tax=Sulfitobacter sediminis TaxID=3234186 RepID=A0ABV3RGV9_9RHOB
MAEALRLIGFEHSVYTWIVRLALREMGLSAEYVEADPFADPPDPVLARYTPLNRVPVLEHGRFRLTETAAILRYLDAISGGPSLQLDDPKAQAQMLQVIGLADADVYPVMVRQVFSPGYYQPVVLGGSADPARVAEGLRRAGPVLSVLEQIAGEGRQLAGGALSLADLHLAPMFSYFTRLPEGDTALRSYSALHDWWAWISARETLRQTDPLAGF